MRTFHGVWPALVTPFTPANEVNVTALCDLVDYQLARKVDGFYLLGSTGEGLFQSVDERELVARTVLDRVAGRAPVIVHVGAAVLRDSVRLARHAQVAGAAGISSILPPVVYDPRGIVSYYETIAGAAPDLPFLPYIFGGPRDAVALMRDLLHIPNLAGTKYTGPNMYEMAQILALRDEGWTVFSGMDEQALYGIMSGASGTIGSTFNLFAGAHRQIQERYRAGNVAGALDVQLGINRVIEAMYGFGFAAALKAAMGFLGVDCGAPRLPNPPLAAGALPALREKLAQAGFFELAAL
ncbi:MAG TPA: dihydrodipicolinate synthase family protein [Anaerolineae bacterium]